MENPKNWNWIVGVLLMFHRLGFKLWFDNAHQVFDELPSRNYHKFIGKLGFFWVILSHNNTAFLGHGSGGIMLWLEMFKSV